MSSFKCEKCCKEFKQKSQYTKHQARKTPCLKEPTTQTVYAPHNAPTIDTANLEKLKAYYDTVLNVDKSTYKNSNDEPTPIGCVEEMISKIPGELWLREDLAILDPCCGNGNFSIPILFKLLEVSGKDTRQIVEQVLKFNDINTARLAHVNQVFCGDKYKLNISSEDFIASTVTTTATTTTIPNKRYDLIVANPPYAKFLENGKRASKNHNLIKDFIEKALSLLKPNGYLLFITPDNWMSYADRNQLIEIITSLQIIHLDIHSAKKYFKKIGSSFTWYVIQNRPAYKDMVVSGIWKKTEYCGPVASKQRKYIPLVYTSVVASILAKTVDNALLPKFAVKTSSDLHRYTKSELISNDETEVFKHRLIHTPSQTVYASRPHKFQDGWKIFISTTDKYGVFVDMCGMTQSIVFILCTSKEEATKNMNILLHPLYVFINNICRWGNFNNIRILQNFPIPGDCVEKKDIYNYFKITDEEILFIEANL
jgi:adenine-specific DNA-methyltransferase